MTINLPRLQPKHQLWNEDLPLRGATGHRQPPGFAGEVNVVNERYLEIGRTPLLVRGFFLALVPFGIGLELPFWFVLMQLASSERSEPVLAVTSLFASGCIAAAIWWCIRIDTAPPRQTPVRFNREAGKVYWNNYKHTWNPFARWGPAWKVWEWATVQAEIHKTAGFNGKVYQVRYSLQLASCKPGSLEVVDREMLLGPSMTTVEFERAWAYICKYMESGLSAVPEQSPQDNSVHYIRSLLKYYEWALPGAWGAQARKDLFGQGVFVSIASLLYVGVTLLAAPVFLALGITNYIALKLAPDVVWPLEVDAESRGIGLQDLAELKAQARPKTAVKPASIVAAVVTACVLTWLVLTLRIF